MDKIYFFGGWRNLTVMTIILDVGEIFWWVINIILLGGEILQWVKIVIL